jgi:uncharacterized membrane protein YphA (DoxX/SURF4 family)
VNDSTVFHELSKRGLCDPANDLDDLLDARFAQRHGLSPRYILVKTAVYLFSDEFKLHLPGGPYDFPAPAVMAFLSGSGEVIFPVLLVLGLGTRLAATGLLFMTCIVELTVPDGWPFHLTWAAMALAIMAWGPGRLSIDYALCRLSGLRVKEPVSA